MTACNSNPGTAQHATVSPTANPASHHLLWIISLNAIHLLEEHGASTSLIDALFDNPHTIILIGPRQTDPFPHSIPEEDFQSYQDVPAVQVVGMASAFSEHRISKEVQVVGYDDERWQFTAASEIADPIKYTQLASELVHQHGLQFLSVPGMDLGGFQSLPQSYESFVNKGYLNIARYDDLFELQLENIEMNPAAYVDLAQQAQKQIKQINPKVVFLLQLTSNPNAQTVTAQDLLQDYHATQGMVDGYAFTIPNSSAICPACGTPNVQPMLTFLSEIGQEIHS